VQYLKEQKPKIQIIGAQPEEGSRIPGIRKWHEEAYLPKIFDRSRVDRVEDGAGLHRKRWRAAWRQSRVSCAGSRQALRAKLRCGSHGKSRTRRLCLLSAIAVIVICRQVCFWLEAWA
jgi:hypothetical protein